jgi:hypothetical protein
MVSTYTLTNMNITTSGRGWGSIPGRGRRVFTSLSHPDALGPTRPPIEIAPGVKREAVHSLPSSAEVKMLGTIPSLAQVLMA